jgi:hypothetical protein
MTVSRVEQSAYSEDCSAVMTRGWELEKGNHFGGVLEDF